MSYEEANLYLYTGRTAVRPLIFSTEYYYTRDKAVLDRDLAHLADAARAVAASFRHVSDDNVPLGGRRGSARD